MFGSLLRPIRAWVDRLKVSLVRKDEPVLISSNERIVERCMANVTAVQERLHLKYNPLEARFRFVRSTHPNILEMIKFLRLINQQLKKPNPQLLLSDFPFTDTDIPLDTFFVSSSGNYISQSAIADLVLETFTMLGYAQALAKVEIGTEEYHFRMLSRTLNSLTSIHGAISTVLAE